MFVFKTNFVLCTDAKSCDRNFGGHKNDKCKNLRGYGPKLFYFKLTIYL